jgi:hypothetical protein
MILKTRLTSVVRSPDAELSSHEISMKVSKELTWLIVYQPLGDVAGKLAPGSRPTANLP